MFRASEADETAKPGNVWPDYLEALELINGAGQTMTALEDHSQRIQAKAFELTQKARADRLAAGQQIASLQQQLAASETRVAELDSLLAEAELRAHTAQEWLRRFLETINGAFASAPCRPAPGGKQLRHGCVAASSAIDGRSESSCPGLSWLVPDVLHATNSKPTSRLGRRLPFKDMFEFGQFDIDQLDLLVEEFVGEGGGLKESHDEFRTLTVGNTLAGTVHLACGSS